MRVAIIHYWLVAMRGGERVLERICAMYPDADIFTHVYDPAAVSATIRRHRVKTTFIARLPNAVRRYQSYLPLMPLALESLDLSGYDLVISSEAGPAKGVIPPPDAAHVCYCHSPMRYVWDQFHAYRESAGPATRLVMPYLAHRLRTWDVASSARVDGFLVNSAFVGRRVAKYYRRDAQVVHPPVPVARFGPVDEVGPDFLWVGQLVPYKRPQLAVEVFNANRRPLTIVGDGPMLKRLKAMAAPNITFRDKVGFSELASLYARCRALVFTAEEDFGIVPVEVNASGRPVIALDRGGARETIVPDVTGLFYEASTVEALSAALERFDAWELGFDPGAAVRNAQRFSPERFDQAFRTGIDAVLASLAHLGAPAFSAPSRPCRDPLAA